MHVDASMGKTPPQSSRSEKHDGRRGARKTRVHKAGTRSEFMDHRKKAAAAGAIAGLLGATGAAAQTRLQDRFWGDDESWTDIASAGNGGVATASANGGAVSIGDVNSGGNAGSAIGVGDTWG